MDNVCPLCWCLRFLLTLWVGVKLTKSSQNQSFINFRQGSPVIWMHTGCPLTFYRALYQKQMIHETDSAGSKQKRQSNWWAIDLAIYFQMHIFHHVAHRGIGLEMCPRFTRSYEVTTAYRKRVKQELPAIAQRYSSLLFLAPWDGNGTSKIEMRLTRFFEEDPERRCS